MCKICVTFLYNTCLTKRQFQVNCINILGESQRLVLATFIYQREEILMASFGGQQRRHDRNYQCPLLDSGGIFEAASKNSSQIMLETPPADVVETISRYFEAALGSSGQTKGTELCHPVTDNIDYSASDSGDSLFITQHPVTEVVRSVKRCHSKKRSKPIDREENGEEDGRSSHPRRHSGIKTFKKGEKYKLKKYSFPFLDKVDRSKCLSSRERAYRGTHLPFLKSVTLASSALGGFFKCVKALKVSKKKATLDLALPKRCLDEDDELPPLPEEEEQSEGSDEDDIRVVENYVFTPSVKEEHKQIWYQHRPRVKTPVSLVSKTSKNAKSNQTPARSWWRIPRKCNMTEEQLCTEVDRWVRSSRCRTDSEELDIDDDDTIVGGNVPQRKKSPSKKRAGNIHKHQEEELVEEDLLNARVVTSLTECELLTESQVLDIVGEGSRERMFMNLTGEIINSPYADVWEITGSCLENAQEVFEAQSVDHLSDHDDLHQTRKMEEELGIKQKHDTHPLRAPEVTKDCTDVEGQKNEHKGKKTKKKKRRKRDVECVDEGVGCGDDHNNIASSVNTGTIQRGEAARMSQNKITEHSVSQCEDVMMAPRKKRRKEKRRESSSHRDTGSKQHMKGRDSLTKNDTVEKNTDIDQITSALFQSEEVAVREKKKRKQEKILTTDTSEDLEARLEKNNVGVSPNTELDSNDTVIQSKKKKKRRKAEKETMVQHQEGDTEKLHETLKSSVSESSGVVSQRKKKKHKVKDRVLETPMGIEEYHEKENEPSQTGKITSSRKKKKKKRSKNPINSIHEDTAAPQEVNSIVISLNKSECYALMEDNTVSHKKEKKKKKNKEISTQLDSEEKPQYGDEISKNKNKATELGMEAVHALIQRSDNPVSNSDDMDTQRKRKKRKRKRKRRTSVDNGVQSSVSQSTEMESKRKRKKKERQMYVGLVVAHEGTIGRRTGEVISEIMSNCPILPEINAVSHSDEMVSSSNKKKKKKRLHDPTKDYLTTDYNDYQC